MRLGVQPGAMCEGKGGPIGSGKPVFVISDLHIRDRSPRDNLCQGNREAVLNSFLDYVTDQNGRLIILGDFLELFRYPLDSIVAHRRPMLDRLARMGTVYVPGNHDEDLPAMLQAGQTSHPFFDRTCRAFVQRVGFENQRAAHYAVPLHRGGRADRLESLPGAADGSAGRARSPWSGLSSSPSS
jgi:3',5'-cyclic AMP phosphodiesterase CpdA